MDTKDLRTPALAIILALALLPFLTSIGDLGAVSAQETEVEPNSDMSMAQEIVAGTFYTGVLDKNADPEDWFKLFVPKGKVLNATVHMDPMALNADLEIHYPYIDGSVERKWSLTEFEYETICIVSVKDQFYHIRVFAVQGSGPYTLDAGITEAPVLSPAVPHATGNLYNNSHNVIDFYRVWLENRGDEADLLEVHMNKTPIGGAEDAWLNLRIMRLYDWNVGIRWYDISWEDPAHEYTRAVATETGWYYIRILAYNGSGNYDIDISISTVQTDGNDRTSDAPLLYGPGARASGSLNQALDHKDCYAVYLKQGEGLDTHLDLHFPFTSPGIFSVTILEPDGSLIGEWTNYKELGLDTIIEASVDTATYTGRYTMIIEAKVGVKSSNHQDLTQDDAIANYTLTITPSGHNSPPKAIEVPINIAMDEDGATMFDLKDMFTDDNVPEGDDLSYSVEGLTIFSGPDIEDPPLTATLNGTVADIAPLGDWSGTGTLKFRATDLFEAEDHLTVYFKVEPINDGPFGTLEVVNVSLMENIEVRPVDLDEIFTDVDITYGDILTYSLEGNDNIPSWIDSGGKLVLGPVIGMGQEEWFTVRATDLDGASATVKVLVEVEKADHAPTAMRSVLPHIIALDEDTTTSIELYTIFSDPDPEDSRLSFVWTGNVHVHLLLADDGTLTFAPDADWSGTEYIIVTAIDHSGLTARVELSVRVDPVGDMPVIVDPTPTLGLEIPLDGKDFTMFAVSVEDKDPDDSHSFSWYMDDDILPRDPASRGSVMTLDPTLLTNGIHVLNLTVRDSYGLKTECSWTLVVDRPVPEPVVRGPTPTETTVTGGLAFGLWFLILAFFTEHGRFFIFKFLWLPLYTKIKKEEILDQFIRGRIYGFIEHNPGVNYTQIKRKMGIGNGTLTHHLGMLEKKSLIKAERDGIYKRFYPKNFQIDEDSVELSTIQKDIYFLTKTNPGISQKEVANELGVSKRVVSYHVRLMLEARLLHVDKRGRRHSLNIVEES